MQFRFDQFVLDIETGTLSREGKAIALRPRAFDLLRVLVAHAPALVTRDQILDEVWGHDALTPNVLPQAISEIRQALNDSAQAPRLIETRHRRGYRMLAPVQLSGAGAVTVDGTEPPTPATVVDATERGDTRIAPPAAAVARPVRGTRWRWWLWPAVAVVAVLALVAVVLFRPPTALPDPRMSRPAVALMIQGGAAAPVWLASAGTELLAVALASDDRIQLLRGDGRSDLPSGSDARWQVWLREVLGADYAVTGLWHGDASRPVLSYSLVRLDDGHVVQGGEADGADVAELSQRVAGDLRDHLRLLPGDRTWLAELPRQADAREAYYRGLAALHQGRAGEAVTALEQAAADDAAGARVWLALASAYRLDGHLGKAREQFARILAGGHGLAVGERLRLEAEAALVDHRPADAAASLRALHRLMPQDGQVALALADAQLQARQARAAAATLASQQTLAGDDSRDPRWHLAQARLAQLDHRLDDARAAIGKAVELAQRFGLDQLAVRAQLELAQIERMQGDPRGASDRLQALLDGAVAADNLRAQVHLLQGSLLRDLGDFERADRELTQAGALFVSLGDHAGELRARIERHTIDSERGQSEAALTALQALAGAVTELDDAVLLARYFNTLGVQAIRNNRIEAAKDWLERAASEARRAGLPSQEAGAFNNLGMALARAERQQEASVIWERALAVFRDSGDRMGEALTLGNLASVASAQGQLPRSHELNAQALRLFRELQAGQHLARTAFNLGLATEREGRLADAEALFEEALSSYRQGAAGDPVMNVAAALVRTRLGMGKVEAARAALAAVAAERDGAGNAVARSHVFAAAGHLAALTGDHVGARDAFERSRGLREQAGQADWLAYSDIDLLELDLAEGKPAEPVQVQAERLFQRLARAQDERGQVRALMLQARAALRRDQPGTARERLAQASALLERNPDAATAHERDRLAILAGPEGGSARRSRLLGLAGDADRAGFVTLALRCRLDADPGDPAWLEQARTLDLAGLLPR